MRIRCISGADIESFVWNSCTESHVNKKRPPRKMFESYKMPHEARCWKDTKTSTHSCIYPFSLSRFRPFRMSFSTRKWRRLSIWHTSLRDERRASDFRTFPFLCANLNISGVSYGNLSIKIFLLRIIWCRIDRRSRNPGDVETVRDPFLIYSAARF